MTAGRVRVNGVVMTELGSKVDPSVDSVTVDGRPVTLAFSLVVSAGTVAHLRGYRAEPYIWGIGLPLALFSAYSRIAADKSFDCGEDATATLRTEKPRVVL